MGLIIDGLDPLPALILLRRAIIRDNFEVVDNCHMGLEKVAKLGQHKLSVETMIIDDPDSLSTSSRRTTPRG